MRRKIALAAAIAAVGSAANAQTVECSIGTACGSYPAYSGAPRDGIVNQAVLNTYCAANQRLSQNGCAADRIAASAGALNAAIDRITGYGTQAPNGPAVSASLLTFQQLLRGISWMMPPPYQLGGRHPTKNPFAEGGSFGGAGAGGEWNSCEDFVLGFDAQNNLIIPSYVLEKGQPIPFGNYFASQNYSGAGASGQNFKLIAHSWQARTRRGIHLTNMSRVEADWYGVVGPMPDGTIQIATVAYRWGNGQIASRAVSSYIGNSGFDGPHSNSTVGQTYDASNHPFYHKPCPETPVAGADYYADSNWSGYHLHNCIAFIPQDSFGWNGYAINKRTTIPWPDSGWPNGAPVHLRECPISPEWLAKLTDKLWQNASEQPTAPLEKTGQVEKEDARPGDTRVGDLGDNPTTGAKPTAPNNGQNVPAPTQPGTPTNGGTTVNVAVDFGPDPGTAAPEVENPTNIFDPVFDWLPDLPSITLDTNNSECPVWAVNMTEFGGPTWQFLLDDHCDLMEANRAAIGALMIAMFGIAAAMIILRA